MTALEHPIRQNRMMAGRFAPSPSGELHLGSLRTALLAWLAARSTQRRFLLRIEDLDPVTSDDQHTRSQMADLAALGLDWDPPVLHQSERLDVYRSVIDQLDADGLVYRCFCTRREIRDEIERASRAPHVHLPDGAYPGTCRDLTEAEQHRRGADRPGAVRLLTDGRVIGFHDRIAGEYAGMVDDVVLARADGIPAYNLAVVVDDHLQGVDQVVRGDDLLSSTPRQILLYRLLGWPEPEYWHVPLVMDGDVRLAKRTGGVTLSQLKDQGVTAAEVLTTLAASLGLAGVGETVTAQQLVDRFDPDLVPRHPIDVSELDWGLI